MAIDRFICVFAAWNANAPLDNPEYLALMEVRGRTPQEQLLDPIQKDRFRGLLIDNYVDQDGQIIIPSDDQFIVNSETLLKQIDAGKAVLSGGVFTNASRHNVEAQLSERAQASNNIVKAERGEDAKFFPIVSM